MATMATYLFNNPKYERLTGMRDYGARQWEPIRSRRDVVSPLLENAPPQGMQTRPDFPMPGAQPGTGNIDVSQYFAGAPDPYYLQSMRNAGLQEQILRMTNSGNWPGGRRGRLALREGYKTLLDLIMSRGYTDPARLNQQIQGIQRGTEANVGQTQEQLASMGLGSSGVGQALAAAQLEGGTARVSQARAAESALAEQRRREDLRLLLDLIINPQLQRRAQDLGLEQWMAGQGGSNQAEVGQAVGALASMFGSIFSGAGA